MFVSCDFHNHSCLSPCGSLEQSPAVLARIAAERGLELVALTDHNSALNTPAFAECARREGIAALYGMEAASAEEVHVLCLFATSGDALGFGEFLLEHMPRLRYDPRRLGDQVVVDADENILEMPETYFGAALELGYDDLCEEAHSWGALVIPAHIDRPMFGGIHHLGFLPEGPYAAVEAVQPLMGGAGRSYTVVTGSDAHYPEHIARRPFSLDLPEGWQQGGVVRLDSIREALAAGRVRLPFAT
jgi:3',5'-nucleoside bisphosphate phosphatase